MRTAIVVNPRSGGGATGRQLGEIEAAARRHLGEVLLVPTDGPGGGRRAAERAVEGGATLVVAVGGDGTANEVVNGLIDAARAGSSDVAFGLVPAGTGCDLAKTLGMPKGWDRAFSALAAAPTRPSDVLIGTMATPSGPIERAAMNILGFGLNGEVVHRVNRSSKRLGGLVTFGLATIRSLASWRAPRVSIAWEGPAGPGGWQGLLATAFCCNARACGGGILPAPTALLDDGLIDLVIVPESPLWRSAMSLPHLYDGRLQEVKGVVTARVTQLTATVDDATPIRVDVDGEQPGTLPLTVAIRNRCLQVRAPATGAVFGRGSPYLSPG